MAHLKPLMNTPKVFAPDTTIHVDGFAIAAQNGEPLIDAINRSAAMRGVTSVPQVCYLEPMGAIGSCDTCMVEIDGTLVRSCEALVGGEQFIVTNSDRADVAQRDAFDRLLENHDLYCTVCDNNNQNCTVHNTTAELDVKHNARPFRKKGYEVDMSNPFYRYDPNQCILCGRCVEACQNVQVNETRRGADRGLELRQLRPLHYGLPMQRADGEGHAWQGRLPDEYAREGAGHDDRGSKRD
jgi:formate dehydrogenase major subunit